MKSVFIWFCVLYLLSSPQCAARPNIQEDSLEDPTTTPPPGLPEILSFNYDYETNVDINPYDDEQDSASSLDDQKTYQDISVEIEAVVSRPPPEEKAYTKLEANTTNILSKEILEVPGRDPVVEEIEPDIGLMLEWWHILLLVIACLLVTCLCCYLTSCCFLTVDCCSDPYWGCCPWCFVCVKPLKPPSHVALLKKDTNISTSYSLNESSTAPRRSVERSTRSLIPSDKGSSKSVNITNGSAVNEGDITVTTYVPQDSSNTLSSSTTNSAKSVRNYKRARPASQYTGENKPEGLSESLPHVYEDGTGFYFSWLHLLGRNKRRYKVSTRKKPKNTNNNNIYRQSRYRHIAESRSSAVITTKISKRSSTASSFQVRPFINKRSRSAETVDSLEDTPPPLEESKSERHIPRSRLSANLAQLEARSDRNIGPRTRRISGRSTPVSCPTAPLLPEYNLKSFEKSLLKSKETTL